LEPAAFRALESANGSVAPTTSPSRGVVEDVGDSDAAEFDQSLARPAIFSKTV
jgi:hypothetical protein